MRSQGGFALTAQVAACAAIAAAVVIAGLAAALWATRAELADVREKKDAEISKLREELGREEQSRKNFQASATSCSDGVREMRAAADAVEAEAEKLRRENEGLSRAVQGHIAALLTRKRADGVSECEAMRSELDEEVDRRRGRRQ